MWPETVKRGKHFLHPHGGPETYKEEQLGLRLAKDRLFKNQAAVLRYGLHMCQRALKNAVKSDETSKKLLDELITKSSGADRSDVGSFAHRFEAVGRGHVALPFHRVALLAEFVEVMAGASWMTYWVHGLDGDDKSDNDENKSMEDLRGAKTQERR